MTKDFPRELRFLIVRLRLPLILLLNATFSVVGFVLALCLRYDFDFFEFVGGSRTVPLLVIPALLLVACRHASYMYFGLNKGYWRYATTVDLANLFKAHFLSTLMFTAALYTTLLAVFNLPGFPRSVIIIEFALSILISGGSRFLVRIGCERFLSQIAYRHDLKAREVIVLGAGDSGHILIKNLLGHLKMKYQPVAVLDDSERLLGTSVIGVPVVGTLSDLPEMLARFPLVSAVIVAIPSISESRFSQIEACCHEEGVAVKRLQSFEDIACYDSTLPQTAQTVESVLEKELHVEHEDEIRQALAGRRILVTGAGGSIGSELVRQILPFKPKQLTLVDQGEYNMYKIGLELAGRDDVNIQFKLCDICDETRLLRIFDSSRPEVVFHAAAYKHVPLMEENCYEAFRNNVVGTRNVLRTAHVCGAQRFVFVSTDKAVDPSNVMGCSKRLSELLVQSYSATYARGRNGKSDTMGPQLQTGIVRFGNVINSAGSVVPLFKEQIQSGGPITVTHPEMERFFMSIREAVRLVLTAGLLGCDGEVYVLDMGRPIKILDVAKKMLALYGRRDIPIKFTGVRPGEKLTETLTNSGEVRQPTRFSKIDRVVSVARPMEDLHSWVAQLASQLDSIPEETLARQMFDRIGSDSEIREDVLSQPVSESGVRSA